MFEEKELKKIVKKNKKISLMESFNWEKEFEENIGFVYYMYELQVAKYAHIMCIMIFLENEVEIEIISDRKDAQVEAVSEHIVEELKKLINQKTEKELNFKDNVDKERLKKYILENDKLKKKFQNYLK